MQISKSFLVVCAAMYCVAVVPLRAADTEAQIKAREALEKKFNELQSQPPAAMPAPRATIPQTQTQPAPVVVPAPAPQPAPTVTAPVMEPSVGGRTIPPAQWAPPPVRRPRTSRSASQAAPAPVVAPAVAPATTPVLVAPTPMDSQSIARAREVLRQKMAELQAQPGTATPQPVIAAPPPAAVTVPAPAMAPPPVVQPVAPAVQPVPAATIPAVQPAATPMLAAPTPADPTLLAKAQEALDLKMKELAAHPPVEPTAPASSTQKVTKRPTAEQILQSFPPLQGPPPAVATAKQQRLDELLAKYKADQITPEEYHQQRARILAEP
ncbi:MAG TPA: hypothetical protein P5205_01430 [Candidatus Paceibacterota bacterium]|nr:hypothetical protein [Verrucomicrobiota bacterium]HSA09011.1 hypothetical protein [Candidatus Paceibacterota bacterium]